MMSIGAKLIAIMIALGVVLLGGLLLVFESLVIPWQVDSLVSEAENTASFVQQIYPQVDQAEMQATLEGLARIDPRLSYLVVVDRSGRAIAHSSRSRVGMVFDDPGTMAAARDATPVRQIYTRDADNRHSPHYGERVVDIVVPSYDAQGRHDGAISVGLSFASLDSHKQRYYQVLLIMALTLALIVVAVAVWAYRDIIRPIRQVDLATRRVDGGDLDISLSSARKDEIGSLARHFNIMSAKIAALLAGMRERNAELQEYIDHLTTLNGRVATDGTVLAVSAAAANIIAKSPDELIGCKLWDAPWWDQSRETTERLVGAVRDAAGGQEVRMEIDNLAWDGTVLTVDFSLKPVMDSEGRVLYLVAEGRDITQRKRVEEALRDSERRLADIISFLPDATYAIDAQGRVTFWNQAVEKLTGVRAADIIGKGKHEYGLAFYGERRPMLIDLVMNCTPALEGSYSHVKREDGALTAEWFTHAIGTDGIAFWSKASPLYDPDGQVIGAIETVRDVTERKQAIEDLHESQRALATLMGNLPGMAYRCLNDRQYTMVFVSDGCLELTGYPAGSLRDNAQVAYGDLIHPDDRDGVWSGIQSALTAKAAFRLIYRIATASGEEKWVWEQGIGVLSDSGQLVALEGFITDVTERVRSEEEKRAFYSETIRSVTQGKLNLVARNQLECIIDSAAMCSIIASPAGTYQARQELHRFFDAVDVDTDRLVLFLTGAGEAMTNAIKHAGEGRVYAGTTADTIWVAVCDNGPGIGALTLPKATLRRGYSSKVSMGMGYSIMLDASDSIQLSSGPDGTAVVLQMHISGSQTDLSLDDLPDTWSQTF